MATQSRDVPVCPHCQSSLRDLQEEYHSIGTYCFNVDTGKFEMASSKEHYGLLCKGCGKVIPNNIVHKLEQLLPKPEPVR